MLEPRKMDYLQPGEESIREMRRHPRSILAAIVGATVFSALVLGAARWAVWNVFSPELRPYWWSLLVVVGLLWFLNAGALFYRMKTSRYVVTKERVYRSHGRLRFHLLQTTYDKVTDLHVRQGPFGRLWGYGEVTVMTAGTGLTLEGVPDPLEAKRAIEQARTRFLNSLIEEYRLEQVVPQEEARVSAEEAARGQATREAQEPDADAEAEAGAAPGAGGVVSAVGGGMQSSSQGQQERAGSQPIWKGRPVVVSLVGAALRGLFFLLFAGGFLFAAISEGTFGIPGLIGVAALFMGVSALFGGFVQYKFTRYQVLDWGVVVTSGWLTRRRVEVTYDKVTDVQTYQGVMGQVFNFGNITINTAGSNQAPVTFAALDKPEEVKEIINETRRRRAEARRGRR